MLKLILLSFLISTNLFADDEEKKNKKSCQKKSSCCKMKSGEVKACAKMMVIDTVAITSNEIKPACDKSKKSCCKSKK